MKRFWVILVSAILLAGVVYGGWKLWVRNHPTKTNNSSQQTNNDPSDGGKYLVIKEWGVRIPLDTNTKMASYTLDSANYVVLLTTQLQEFSKQYSACSKAGVAMQRLMPGYDHYGSPWTEEDLKLLGTKIGNYYYMEDPGHACEQGSGVQAPNYINAIRSSFSEAIKGVIST